VNGAADGIDALISDHLDGVLDDAGTRRLEAWLECGRANQERYLRMVMDHRALLEHHAMARHQAGRRPSRARPAAWIWRRTVPFAALCALAAALAVALLWWHAPAAPGQPAGSAEQAAQRFATLGANTGASVRRGAAAQALGTGAELRAGDRVTVAAGGRCELRCDDGTLLRLADDAELVLGPAAAGKRVELLYGRLEAEFTPQPPGHPAVIATPEAEVTVRGTVLTVVSRDGESRTEVSHGAVTLTRLADRAAVPLRSGEYAIAAPQLALAAHLLGEPSGTRYAVGAGQPYATLGALPALHPGDVVELHPGSHRLAYRWTASGTRLRPITVRGVGSAPAVIDGEGLNPGIGALPHGLFHISGAHLVIEHLDFANARNGGTAAGILCTDGARHTVIRDCRITSCDKGIEATDDDLLIEDCEIGRCGSPGNDGHCHALLLAGLRAVVRRCDIHDALNGQAIKSASRYLELRSCRITDAEDGEIGIVDEPAGTGADGNVVLIGNLVASKGGRRGNQQRFIEVGDEGGGNRAGTLYLIGNTLVAADGRNLFINTAHAAMRTVAIGNIFSGSDRIAMLGAGGFSGRRNWMPASASVPPGAEDNVRATSAGAGFADPEHRDFRLRADAACRGQGLADARYRDDAGRACAVEPWGAPGPTAGQPAPSPATPPCIGAYPALP
jgi:ferric-dicitrate binding protein FerR (iron transport regulator)